MKILYIYIGTIVASFITITAVSGEIKRMAKKKKLKRIKETAYLADWIKYIIILTVPLLNLLIALAMLLSDDVKNEIIEEMLKKGQYIKTVEGE